MDIIVSDFDGVLFKKYHGLLQDNIDYVLSRKLPVYIVTFRKDDQYSFIISQLRDVPLVGIAFAGSRNKDPLTKVVCVREIQKKYNIVEALDNDADVVLHYMSMGIPVKKV